jgi:hypothetical protein
MIMKEQITKANQVFRSTSRTSCIFLYSCSCSRDKLLAAQIRRCWERAVTMEPPNGQETNEFSRFPREGALNLAWLMQWNFGGHLAGQLAARFM